MRREDHPKHEHLVWLRWICFVLECSCFLRASLISFPIALGTAKGLICEVSLPGSGSVGYDFWLSCDFSGSICLNLDGDLTWLLKWASPVLLVRTSPWKRSRSSSLHQLLGWWAPTTYDTYEAASEFCTRMHSSAPTFFWTKVHVLKCMISDTVPPTILFACAYSKARKVRAVTSRTADSRSLVQCKGQRRCYRKRCQCRSQSSHIFNLPPVGFFATHPSFSLLRVNSMNCSLEFVVGQVGEVSASKRGVNFWGTGESKFHCHQMKSKLQPTWLCSWVYALEYIIIGSLGVLPNMDILNVESCDIEVHFSSVWMFFLINDAFWKFYIPCYEFRDSVEYRALGCPYNMANACNFELVLEF